MTSLVGLFLAGLALFLTGVSGVRANLQQLTGRRFRRLLARWTRHAVLAGVWGFVFGAVTQSATAVSFILAVFIDAGSLSVPRALMVVGWASVGTAALVFVAAINVQLAVLYLVGLTGLAMTFEVAPRFKPGFAALFSAGLMFVGLSMLKQAFAPLPDFAWFHTAAEFARGSDLAAAVFGMLLRTVIQSASTIAVLAVALSHAGLLTNEQLVMMIFGTTIGVTLSSFLLSSDLKGVPRQIILFHGAVNGVSGLLCIVLAVVEKVTGWPLILSWIAAAPGGADTRLSTAFLLVMIVVAAVSTATAGRAPAWLTRWSPPTREQGLSRPRHLQDEALQDPETALALAEREEVSLLGGLPAYLDAARGLRGTRGAAMPPDAIHRAFAAVAKAVQEYATSLADQGLSHASSSRLLALERRLGILEALNDSLRRFADSAGGQRRQGRIGALTDDLIEATDTVLRTAVEAWNTRAADDVATLAALTEDRSSMMERIRRTFMEADSELEHRDKAGLFHLTSLFERIVWLLHQVGLSVPEVEGL